MDFLYFLPLPMRLADFDFHLPPHLIAQAPRAQRTDSRLMVVHRATGELLHDTYANIGKYLPAQSTLVFNRSKVLPARLIAMEAGKEQEVFLLKAQDEHTWECLVRPGKHFKVGQQYRKTFVGATGQHCTTDLTVAEGTDGTRILRFSLPVSTLLAEVGRIPLPPYITHNDPSLWARYQTVYAQEQGSVAAPTAGLHFTQSLLAQLTQQGHHHATVLLHVGMGTFKPVQVEHIADHTMHHEWFSLDEATATTLNQRKAAGSPIIAVGTTSTRVLESCAHQRGHLTPTTGETNIFIYPPYEFQFIDHLITNFHLPQSTLLMLVSAFAGIELTRCAYQEAIAQEYHFYSFGDGMLIL